MADLSDPAIDEGRPLRQSDRSDNLKMMLTGTGGLGELRDALDDRKASYAYVRRVRKREGVYTREVYDRRAPTASRTSSLSPAPPPGRPTAPRSRPPSPAAMTPRKLSREATDGLRQLRGVDPERFTTPVLAERIRICPRGRALHPQALPDAPCRSSAKGAQYLSLSALHERMETGMRRKWAETGTGTGRRGASTRASNCVRVCVRLHGLLEILSDFKLHELHECQVIYYDPSVASAHPRFTSRANLTATTYRPSTNSVLDSGINPHTVTPTKYAGIGQRTLRTPPFTNSIAPACASASSFHRPIPEPELCGTGVRLSHAPLRCTPLHICLSASNLRLRIHTDTEGPPRAEPPWRSTYVLDVHPNPNPHCAAYRRRRSYWTTSSRSEFPNILPGSPDTRHGLLNFRDGFQVDSTTSRPRSGGGSVTQTADLQAGILNSAALEWF
ncbi:hypothetical protein B0H19DRAFT_1248373 [Mycena capillaripes]|nr:hypothetical protein B0H19DRAFT_1248373 [Mycena capillaripes]